MAALSEVGICNMALNRIGARRVTSIEEDNTEVNAIRCRTHYDQTRDALLRSHWWRFAVARAELSEDATAPDFQWENQFILPSDFLRLIDIYDSINPYELEGERLLTDDDSVDLKYVKGVTDATKFDPLFVEVLVLQLAMKLVMPISRDKVLRAELADELRGVLSVARRVNMDERNRLGRMVTNTWLAARDTDARIDSQLGSS